jgi:hypothetical protein
MLTFCCLKFRISTKNVVPSSTILKAILGSLVPMIHLLLPSCVVKFAYAWSTPYADAKLFVDAPSF